jgi:hypothetical protein
VGGDHLVILDPRFAQRLLHAPAGMDAGASVVAVADEQRRELRHRSIMLHASGRAPSPSPSDSPRSK